MVKKICYHRPIESMLLINSILSLQEPFEDEEEEEHCILSCTGDRASPSASKLVAEVRHLTVPSLPCHQAFLSNSYQQT
jgi:hypothetical protein